MTPLLLLAVALAAGPPDPSAVHRPPGPPDGPPRGRPAESRRGLAPVLSETAPGAARRDPHAEHRASRMRTLYLATPVAPAGAEVLVQRPSGEVVAGRLVEGPDGWQVPVDTAPADASVDGIFGVYVITRAVEGDALVVRTAKYDLVNHSCGWGHPFRFDEERRRPKEVGAAPLELVGHGRWDDHFHVKTRAGDTLRYAVLRGGRPVPGAAVTVRTRGGWSRAFEADPAGEVAVQLIRESWPERWTLFDRNQRTPFVVTAEVELPEGGELEGRPYRRTRLVTTLPWRYQPSRQEYTSLEWGLGVALAAALAAAVAVFRWRERRVRPLREVRFDEAP